MKKYMIFAPGIHRLFTMILCPIVVFAFLLLLLIGMPYTLALLILALIPAYEIVADYWIFDGLYKKGGANIRFLMTSNRGEAMLRGAARAERHRFLIYDLLLVGVSAILGTWDQLSGKGMLYGLGSHLAIVLMLYSVTLLGVLITRHFQIYWVNYAVAYFVIILVQLSGYLLEEYAIILFAVSGAIALLLSVLHEWLLKRKIKEGFFDERPKTGI